MYFYWFPILAIGFIGWGIYTWIPMIGYIGGSIGLACLFNKARKTIENMGMGIGYDDKRFLSESDRSFLIEKTFIKRGDFNDIKN